MNRVNNRSHHHRRPPARLASPRISALMVMLAALSGCPHNGMTPPPSATPIALQLVADGLTSPVDLAQPADGTGRLFIADQIGQVRVIDSAGTLRSAPFLDLAGRIVPVGIDFGGGFVYDERGLLGLAFHPQYAANGRLFVFYNVPTQPGDPPDFNSRVRVSEFHVSASAPDLADAASERVLLEVLKPQFNHNGGQIAFGPDGFLYIAIGDGGAANDVGAGHTPGTGNGQDRGVLLGKILRIDVDGAMPYAIPADNPFVGIPDARAEIWAYGFRNPFRFSFDSGGAHRLFAGDVGQDLFEEVDIVDRGANYGWHLREGNHCFDPSNPSSPPSQCATTGAAGEPLHSPIIEYPHSAASGQPAGIAVVGGYVYRGSAIPELQGAYVFADFSTSFIVADGSLFVAIEQSDGSWQSQELPIANRSNGRPGRFVLALGRDLTGEVYLLTSANLAPRGQTGQVHRLIPAP